MLIGISDMLYLHKNFVSFAGIFKKYEVQESSDYEINL